MTLEERVDILESKVKYLQEDYWTNLGRLTAMQSGIVATAGEPDPELRPTLLKDLVERGQATLLAQAITDEQLDLVKRAYEHTIEALQRAFERALVRPEFRQPVPRRKQSS